MNISVIADERQQCKMDSDCASKLACFSGKCQNPCLETSPCGTNAECMVVDTLPLRTMSCSCLPGFVGDADVECKPGIVIYLWNTPWSNYLNFYNLLLKSNTNMQN